MKETTIHFQGQDYQIKYTDKQSYYLNGLVITPIKANDHDHLWMNMIGLNESRYVIYSPNDTGGTGINIYLCPTLDATVQVMIFSKGNQYPIFEQLGTTDEDGCFSITYPERLQEGEYLLYISDTTPNTISDNHFHAYENGLFFEFEVLRHGSLIKSPMLGFEGFIHGAKEVDFVGTSGTLYFQFDVLNKFPEKCRLTWKCFDASYQEIDGFQVVQPVEYEETKIIQETDKAKTMQIAIESYLPWMPDCPYTICLYTNNHLFAYCRFSLHVSGITKKFLITPLSDDYHRRSIEAALSSPIKPSNIPHSPVDLMRLFIDYMMFGTDCIIPSSFEKKLSSLVIKHYAILSTMETKLLEYIIYDGPISKTERRYKRAIQQGLIPKGSPITYDADKDLKDFYRVIKFWKD